MYVNTLLYFLLLAGVSLAQRSPYAGRRPIGYPQLETIFATTDDIANRFGDGQSSTTTTTQRLPLEALGDRNLVNRLSKLPIDHQPFWFINWQALEDNRKRPQTYPHNPNSFIDIYAVNQPPQGPRFEEATRSNEILQSKSSIPSVTNERFLYRK